jgi:signal transduction histidine kinase
MQVIHRLGTRSSCELRSAIFALRSPYLAKGTVLVDLLHDQVRDFQAMSGIAATLIIPPQFPNLPLPIGEAIYRIVCESLSNVHKHAKAQAVVVSLHDDERAVILTVQDDGIGLSDPAHLENCSTSLHFGIEIMRQLTEQVQGEFFIANNDDQGVMVRAHIPVHGASPS